MKDALLNDILKRIKPVNLIDTTHLDEYIAKATAENTEALRKLGEQQAILQIESAKQAYLKKYAIEQEKSK